MKEKILKSALVLTIANILLRLLGFARELVLASEYGASVVTDAYVVASTIPGTVLAFVAGSVASMYIPLYQRKTDHQSRFTSNILNIFVVIGLLFSIIFTIFPKPLVYLFASQLDEETFALAATLLQAMIWSSVPILLADIFRGYLQIHGIFFKAAIANAAVNLCVISSIFLSKPLQSPVLMGLGVILGNVLCLGYLFRVARKRGFAYQPYLNPFDEDIKELLLLILPVVMVNAMGAINQVIDRNFASSLETGAISSLNYSGKVINLATTLTGTMLATVLFPKMSESAAKNDIATLKRVLMSCVRKLMPILLPLAAGTVLLADPIVQVLFERGAFSPEDTKRTAECLQMYALCLVGGGVHALQVRALYATKRTTAPAVVAAVSIGVDVILNILLIRTMQHRGLALSTSISSIISVILLFVVLRKAFGNLGLRRELKEHINSLLATVVMAVAVWGGYRMLPLPTASTMMTIVYTGVLVLAGMTLYAVSHILLHSEFYLETTSQLKKLAGRLKKRV